MMIMLTPKSAKALLQSNLPIEQGRIKLRGSFSFGGDNLCQGDALCKLDILPGLRERFPSVSSCLDPRMVTHGLNCCESFGRCHPKNWSMRIKQLTVHSSQTLKEDIYLLMTIDVLLRSLGWWAIPLDKGSFEEIPGIDSSWGEFVHPSLHGSGKNKGKNLEHDCVLRNSGNIEYAKDAEDPINVIVSILVLISEEGVFPQFAHELTLDLEIDTASDFWLTMPGAWFSRDNAKYCSMVRVLMSTPAIVPVNIEFRERKEITK
ncbi:hypothetical protein Tco_1378353 [Tanacetum coccineum]